MSTTLASLRQKLLEKQAIYISLATTSAGSTTTTLVSTQLNRYDNNKDDRFNEMWVLVTDTGSNASTNERQIKDYAYSTGTVTPYAAFTAQVETAKNFQVLPWEPTLIKNCINEARFKCWPFLRVDLMDESTVTGNWLKNGHMEDWAATTAPDGWASSGSPTLTEETTVIRGPRGSSALKSTSGTSGYIYQSQVEWPQLLDLEGYTATFKANAYAGTASKVRLQVYTKTTAGTEATTNSSYHSGGSEYEPLSVEASIPSGLSDIQLRLVTGDITCYFDNVRVMGGINPDCLYLPSSFYKEPFRIWRQVYGDSDDIGGMDNPEELFGWQVIERDNGDRALYFPYELVSDQKLRLLGGKLLSEVTTDAGTMEVDYDEVTPVVEMALAELNLRFAAQPTPDDKTRFWAEADRWEARGKASLRRFGKPMCVSVLKGLY